MSEQNSLIDVAIIGSGVGGMIFNTLGGGLIASIGWRSTLFRTVVFAVSRSAWDDALIWHAFAGGIFSAFRA